MIFRYAGDDGPSDFQIRDIGNGPGAVRKTLPLVRDRSDVIDCLVGDFSEIQREGMYQVSIADELSTPFFIRPDVWRRTLPKAAGYYRYQRCGVEVPGVHPACHLDDARRRDNGQQVDVTGGWHDAGDLRKWMDATLLNAIGLLRVVRNLGAQWDAGGSGVAPLLDEVRWGNRYFLKMQDADGLVWADVAGGVNGDNSDNHWTDNRAGTADDRYLNPAKRGRNQALFITVQAMAAQAFQASDAAYAKQCLTAAQRCWSAAKREGNTGDLAWWLMAALEMRGATGGDVYASGGGATWRTIAGAANRRFRRGAEGDPRLLARRRARPESLHRRHAFGAAGARAPRTGARAAGAFRRRALARCGAPAPGRVRGAAGGTLRVRHRAVRCIHGVAHGGDLPAAGGRADLSLLHAGAQAVLVARHDVAPGMLRASAGRSRADVRPGAVRDLAYRQLEWVMGANPFGACLMTGEGMRNPYPHSRFVGLIPGGIMNGIAGNTKDAPILDMQNGFDWRTTEYWSPHNAYYLWTVSTLARGA